MRLICFLFSSTLLFTACPSDTPAEGPVDECVRVGTQCHIQGGQLGVCTSTVEGGMICAPQH